MEAKTISGLNITKVLGHGTPPALIISSVLFALILFFYIYTVGSYFQADVYRLENRVTYSTHFDSYIVDQNIDHAIIVLGTILWLALSITARQRIVVSAIYGVATLAATLYDSALLDTAALLSFPIMISFLIYNRFAIKKILNHSTNLSLNYVAISAIGIGLLGFIISINPLFSVSPQSTPVPNYMHDIFILISSISQALVFFLILFSPAKLLIKKFTSRAKINEMDTFSKTEIKRKTKILLLLLFMFLAVVLALVPHYPTINANNHLVGADSLDYVSALNKLEQSTTSNEFIKQVFTAHFTGDRPLTILFLHTISKISPTDLFYTIDHIPIILGPVLVLAVFFLTRELTSDDTTSLFASFLTVVSFHTINGIYSGIYANWLALMFGYMSFVFLIRFLKIPSKLNFAVCSTFVMLLLFSHVYTWAVLMLVMGIFLAALYKMNYYQRKNILLLFLIIFSSVAVDVTRSQITGISGDIEKSVGIATKGAGLEQLSFFWNNLTETVQNYAGGQYSNFIILSLGLYWLIRSNSQKLSNVFLLIFLSIGVLPLLFGNEIIQSRVFYEIPFQIPAAIALTYIKKEVNGNLMVVPICIWLLVVSIETVSNFYLIMPS